jgi:hypothetical protein
LLGQKVTNHNQEQAVELEAVELEAVELEAVEQPHPAPAGATIGHQKHFFRGIPSTQHL